MVVIGIATIVVLVLIVGVTVLATSVERRKHGTVVVYHVKAKPAVADMQRRRFLDEGESFDVR